MLPFNIVSIFILLALSILAKCHRPQPNVITSSRKHSVFLWMWLKDDADFRHCAKPFMDLQGIVHEVSRDPSDCSNAILAGVGFGSRMYTQLDTDAEPFEYVFRPGRNGSFPASGGDIFIHAKSNSQGKLFGLTQKIISLLPSGGDCLERFDDVYSFRYEENRDLSGFIDGTNNAKLRKTRIRKALDSRTGGSFALSQRWEHQMDKIALMGRREKEGIIGRTLKESDEIHNKPSCSHLAKMKGGTEWERVPAYFIYRQGGVYGSLRGPAGLFFAAFATSTANFESMLDAMIGRDGTNEDDCVFLISQCVSGNYWYFPGRQELLKLKEKLYK